MAKIALYTVLTGGYDNPSILPRSLVNGVDCFMVTDNPDVEIRADSAWVKKVVEAEKDPHRHQRRLKIRFHELFPEYDTVVYVDANVNLQHALVHLLAFHKGGMTTGTHPKRDCVYQEAIACEQLSKADPGMIRAQVAAYRAEGIPERLGMFQTGFIIRSNTAEVREFCEKWHDELEKHTHRDQLSVTVAAHRMGFKIHGISWATLSRAITISPHRVRSRYGMIHYLTPYAPDGNIGKAYNEAIELLPGRDDWVVLRDGDTLFTTPNWGRHIAHVLEKTADEYQLYGAMTNRIRSSHQQIPGMFDQMDLREHARKGQELEEAKWGEVAPGGSGVAGFFMAFRKSQWAKHPFPEKSATFDTAFSRSVTRSGGKIGLMSGLYLIHLYRIWAVDPFSSTSHLDVVKGD